MVHKNTGKILGISLSILHFGCLLRYYYISNFLTVIRPRVMTAFSDYPSGGNKANAKKI